ncbi:MAG: hypothetical protein BWY31_01579 [Lentisphaerae bacterium ADurb.Bin242]|nr:MAG: hypothetical protein BWY31_01579 [Lentisphaerae bacterium ADurb.Bin242]
MKTFITLLFAGLLSAVLAQEKTVVFEKQYPKGQELVFPGYVRSVPIERNFIRTLSTLKSVKMRFEADVSASSPEASFGAKFRPFLREGENPPLHNFCWKQKIADGFTKITAENSFEPGFERNLLSDGTLLLYNCTQKGTITVRSFKLTATGIEEKQPDESQAPKKTIVNDGKVPDRELSVKRDFFPAGVYFYTSKEALLKLAEKRKISPEEMFGIIAADIAKHNCNTIYLSGVSGDPGLFKTCCRIADQHGLKVIAQGNGVLYVRPERGNAYYESTTLPAHKKILPELDGPENLIGFTVKEEVDPEPHAMALLRRARKTQKELMPHIPVFTLHNRLASVAMDDDPESQPDWYAFDMYRFKLHPDRKVIMTPSKAAYRISTNLELAYIHAMRFGRPLIFVAQGVRSISTIKSDKLTKSSGMKQIEPGVWRGYVRYMPKNGMNLQFWLGVMSGCRGILIYHYMDGGTEKALVDKDLKPTWYWEEFSECLNEAKALFPLFASWYKQNIGEVSADVSTVFVRTFRHPGFRGLFLLPVNTQIASWDKNNPRLTNAQTQLYSDEENLQGFAWAGPQTFRLSLKEKMPVWDVLTGKQIDPAAITLPPGKGRVLYQGTENELREIRTLLKIAK